MKITENEIRSVSLLEAFDRYLYAIKRIADHTNLFLLKNSKGEWAISKIEDNNLFPIWSAPEYAKKCAIDGWSGFEVDELPLKVFEETLIDQIKAEGFLLNIFPVTKTTGFVVSLDEFVRDLKEELQKYE